jgi:hypothetical protein
VSGLDLLLTTWEHLYRERMPATQLAYALGTTYHETAATMQPVKEYGSVDYFTRMYDITGSRPALARSLGNTTPGDGARYAGRGFVQLTGKANYRKATEKLAPLGATVDLVAKPDDAMLPDVAALVLFEGMEEGWFTSVKLDDVIDGNVDGDEHADFIRARTDHQRHGPGRADRPVCGRVPGRTDGDGGGVMAHALVLLMLAALLAGCARPQTFELEPYRGRSAGR